MSGFEFVEVFNMVKGVVLRVWQWFIMLIDAVGAKAYLIALIAFCLLCVHILFRIVGVSLGSDSVKDIKVDMGNERIGTRDFTTRGTKR